MSDERSKRLQLVSGTTSGTQSTNQRPPSSTQRCSKTVETASPFAFFMRQPVYAKRNCSNGTTSGNCVHYTRAGTINFLAALQCPSTFVDGGYIVSYVKPSFLNGT